MMQAFIREHPGLHRAICQATVETLNEALAADPVAINQFFALEAVVNTDELRDHPTIQVGNRSTVQINAGMPDAIVMRPLGLINGLFGADEESWGYIYVRTNGKDDSSDWIDYFFCHFRDIDGFQDVAKT